MPEGGGLMCVTAAIQKENCLPPGDSKDTVFNCLFYFFIYLFCATVLNPFLHSSQFSCMIVLLCAE